MKNEIETGLAAMLRQGTRRAHRTVENVAFIRAFFRGVVDERAYVRLLSFYFNLYSTLEWALETHAGHPVVGPLARPELYRRRAVLEDLTYFAGDVGAIDLTPSPATQAYCARIRALADEDPRLLVAHAYTRYLGDLSGGQILKGIVCRALALRGGEGQAFYQFPEISDLEAYKTGYRATLDALPLAAGERCAIVAEAVEAFRANQRVFEELEGNAWVAFLKVMRPSAARVEG